MRFAVFGNDGFGFLVGQVFNALQGAQVELHPDAFVIGIDEAIGMTAETVHVAIGIRNATGAHGDGHLMERFGQKGPEIPVVVRAAHIGARVALDGVIQVRKFQRVTQEEYGGIISYQVPVAFFSIELHCKTTDVTLGIGSPALTGHGRETDKALRLLAYFAEDGGTGVLRNVMCHGKRAISTGAFGMHTSFGNHFTVKVGEFLKKPRVLHHDRTTLSGCLGVLIVGDWSTISSG